MEELEIEFKNLLDYETFAKLRDSLFKDIEPVTHTNFYIDTPDHQFIDQKIALRIRDSKGRQMMTLKIPQEIGVMEYHGEVADHLLDDQYIPPAALPSNIHDQLTTYPIDLSRLLIVGALSTERRETPYDSGLLVLDASCYLDCEDYEVEFEAQDYESGHEQFEQFLIDYAVPKKTAMNKVQRFYTRRSELIGK
ncbi:CYTH domain-containing protein [Macrococcus equipercicus]|uniref:CYTH domain-containing protein n=1 Tax=Macrococcus equipercicus TaxID=69967 RepID=A0A9Q9F1U7_9STAP|nr:CYTH domain-containing protein [Macrococcus equipercicus]UTH14458.1 CYTH domain-containing protein [Macrococcus equipercicus]